MQDLRHRDAAGASSTSARSSAAIKEFFGSSPAVPVHGSDQPAGRADAQAPSFRAGPGRPDPRPRVHWRCATSTTRHYGRMCPIETPEGPNIGLISYARDLRPHQRVRLHRGALPHGRSRRRATVTDEVTYMTADEEDNYIVASGQRAARRERLPSSTTAYHRAATATRSSSVDRDRVDYIDVSPAHDGLHRDRHDPVP